MEREKLNEKCRLLAMETPLRTIIASVLIALAAIPLIAVPTADHTAGAYIIMLVTSKAIAIALFYGAIRILGKKITQ